MDFAKPKASFIIDSFESHNKLNNSNCWWTLDTILNHTIYEF